MWGFVKGVTCTVYQSRFFLKKLSKANKSHLCLTTAPTTLEFSNQQLSSPTPPLLPWWKGRNTEMNIKKIKITHNRIDYIYYIFHFIFILYVLIIFLLLFLLLKRNPDAEMADEIV